MGPKVTTLDLVFLAAVAGDVQPAPAGSEVSPARSGTGPTVASDDACPRPRSRPGAIAGAAAGLIACAISKLLTGVIPGSTARTVVFLGLVGLMLGGLLTAWQSFISGTYRAAVRRFAIGGVLGAVSAAASLYPADRVKRAMRDGDPRSISHTKHCHGSDVGTRCVTAVCLLGGSFAKTAIIGFLTGAISGFLGGLVFGATSAKFDHIRELVDLLRPTTFLTVAGVCAAIGAVFGRVTAIRRLATLRIMEGRNQGMEVVVERPKRRSVQFKADVVLAGDDGVVGTHLSYRPRSQSSDHQCARSDEVEWTSGDGPLRFHRTASS